MDREYVMARKSLLKILTAKGYDTRSQDFLKTLKVNTPKMRSIIEDFCDRMGVMSPYEFEEQAADSILEQLKTGEDLIEYAARTILQGERREVF